MLNAIKVFISNIYFLFTNNMIMFVEASNMLTISFSNQLAEKVTKLEDIAGERLNSTANEMNQLKLDVANSMQRYSSMVSKLRRDVDRLNELENINIRRHYEGGPENGI